MLGVKDWQEQSPETKSTKGKGNPTSSQGLIDLLQEETCQKPQRMQEQEGLKQGAFEDSMRSWFMVLKDVGSVKQWELSQIM